MGQDVGFIDVIQAPEFEDAWRSVVESATNYRDFAKLPMPAGCKPQDLWNLFSKLRRISGTTVPVNVWVNTNSNVGWFCLPGQSENKLAKLRRKASSTSQYNDYIRTNSIDDYYLHSFIFCEVRSLAARDGIKLQSSTLRDAWLHRLEPANPVEQLAVNIERIFHDTDRYAKRRFSQSLLEDVYEQLCQGIDEDYKPQVTRRFNIDVYTPRIFNDEDFLYETLDQVLAIIRNDTVFHDDFLCSIQLTATLWDLPVFPRFGHLLEYLIRRIYFMRIDNPILSFVPYAFASNRDEGDYESEQGRAYSAVEESLGTQEGIDSTILFARSIDIYYEYVEHITDLIDQLKGEEKGIMARIDALPELNYRQRGFLAAATRNHNTLYKIQQYQNNYRVAYATARQDLFDLVERGFLSMRKMGKAFVFQSVPTKEWPL